MKQMPKDFFEKIFWIQNQIKFNHWKERSGWRHKKLGDFYDSIDKNFDYLVEVTAGLFGEEIFGLISDGMYKVDQNMDIETLISDIFDIIVEYRLTFLTSADIKINGLINVLDQILQDIAQYKYLLNKK